MDFEDINEQFLEIMMNNQIGVNEVFEPLEQSLTMPDLVITVIPKDIYDVWVLFLELYGNRK
jgi:hypothetical protein|tara:strand:+ start:698 stop:883 length:186 start_codon:yes stop_codon:yes gene_type:complete